MNISKTFSDQKPKPEDLVRWQVEFKVDDADPLFSVIAMNFSVMEALRNQQASTLRTTEDLVKSLRSEQAKMLVTVRNVKSRLRSEQAKIEVTIKGVEDRMQKQQENTLLTLKNEREALEAFRSREQNFHYLIAVVCSALGAVAIIIFAAIINWFFRR